jgi:sugar O-acyltransferase (sialic acid O-acetyltransferase NeuD family)
VEPRDLVIVGTGGTSVDILDAVLARQAVGDHSLRPVCFLDDNPARIGGTLHGLPVRGPLETARDLRDCLFINGIGSPKNFWRRDQIVQRLGVPIDRFATVTHPTASVSARAIIGPGSAILQLVTVSANARVGAHVVVLPNSVVSHDCVIGDHTCITGGVCVSGGVTVEPSCYLGTNSVVNNSVVIGRGSLIGMGAVVLRNVPSNSVVVGNPARFLRPVVDATVSG